MALTITLSNTSGASYIFSKILQFQLKKEVYTPYTTFSAQFQTDGLKKFGTICKVIVQNGSQVVHEGTVETLTVQTNASVTTISLLSYGFTKLLLHSELAPGLYPNLSINSLLSGYYQFPPEITWESNSDSTNYVYFKEHIPVWYAISYWNGIRIFELPTKFVYTCQKRRKVCTFRLDRHFLMEQNADTAA